MSALLVTGSATAARWNGRSRKIWPGCTTSSSVYTHSLMETAGQARLALNLVLVRLGYPPVVIFKRQRSAYLIAMQRADAGDCGALGELIARAMYDNLNRFIVPNIAGPARIVPLAALAGQEFSLTALRRGGPRGRLDAVQGPTASGAAPARPSAPTRPPGISGGRAPPSG